MRNLYNVTLALAALAAFAQAVLVPGCKGSPEDEYQAALTATDKPAAHAVHSERLVQVMNELERITQDRLPKELDTEAQKQRKMEEIAAVAADLAMTADDIPAILGDVELPEETKDEFRRLAKALETDASQFQADAPNLSTSEVRMRITALGKTCESCHQRFRILPTVGS